MAESLESRMMLAADVLTPFQNPNSRSDVNDDAQISVKDVLVVIQELRHEGPRHLLASASSQAEGEGPAAASMYVDVDGDNYLSISDALGVVKTLRGESGGEARAQNDPDTQTPLADLEDYFLPVNSGPVVLEVIANDQGDGILTITDFTQPINGGTVSLDQGMSGGALEFTPTPNFNGTATFTYTLHDDGDDTFDTATVVVHIGTVVEVDVEILDPTGTTSIDTVEAGEEFLVRVSLQDVREGTDPPDIDKGVFSAYLDMTFMESAVNFQDLAFGDSYSQLRDFGTLESGELNEVGASQAIEGTGPLGPDPVVFYEALFSAEPTIMANATFDFQTNPADEPGHEVLLARPPQLVPLSTTNIDFGGDTLTVTPPIGAVPDAFDTPEDTPAQFDVLANDVPFDMNSPLLVTGLGPSNQDTVTTSQGGTATVIGAVGGAPQVMYTPPENFNTDQTQMVDTFTYVVSDGQTTDTALVTVSVTPAVDDPPMAVDDEFGGPDMQVTSSQTPISLDVLENDSDPDGDTISIAGLGVGTGPFTNTTLTTPLGNQAAISGGAISYTPANAGTDVFNYTIVDTDGLTDTAQVMVTVDAFENIVAVDVRFEQNGNEVTTVATGTTVEAIVTVEDLRTLAPPNVNVLGLFSAFVDFTFPEGIVDFSSITVTPGSLYDNEFGTTGTLTPGEVDEIGSPLTNLGGPPPGGGPVELFTFEFITMGFGTGTFGTNPAEDFGNDILTFDPVVIVDPQEDVEFGSSMLTVIDPNAGVPVAVDDDYVLNGTAQFVAPTRATGVLANDVDPEGNNTIQVINVDDSNLAGTVDINANGSFTFTPNAGFFGETSFTYQATDGGNTASNTATVTFDVRPGAVDDQYEADENQQIAPNTPAEGVLGNDRVGAGSVAQLVTDASRGNLVFNVDGTFVYTPDANSSYVDSFTYRVNDNGMLSEPATVTLAVGEQSLGMTGRVYFDRDQNGAYGVNERAIGNVEIILRQGGVEIDRAITMADGTYNFDNVQPGNYTLEQVHPRGTTNGSPNVVDITVGAGGQLPLVDFTEMGLRPEHLDVQDFFGSSSTMGFNVATTRVGGNGESQWFSLLDGWDGTQNVQAELSADLSTATITVDGQSVTLSTTGDPRLRIQGPDEGHNGLFVLRVMGSPATFFNGFGGGGEPQQFAQNVDQIFAEGGVN